MTLRVYLDGDDVTDQLDLSRAIDTRPGHFPTEFEVRKALFGEPVPIDHTPGHDCFIVNCIRYALAKATTTA